MKTRAPLALALAIVLLPALAGAQAPADWRTVSARALAPLEATRSLDDVGAMALLSAPDSPPLLVRPVAALDTKRGRLLVMEGAYGTGWPAVYGLDLAAETWTTVDAGGSEPVGRIAPSLVYDSRRDRLILFAGDGYNDVWTLPLAGKTTWTPLVTGGDRPSARSAHSAVYDAAHDRMIVFGGRNGTTYLGDTWALALDTDRWTALATVGPRPPARAWHRAAVVAGGTRMVVFGGTSTGGPLGDLWSLDLGDTAWTALTPAGAPPSPRYACAFAADSLGANVYVHGGVTAGGFAADLWALRTAGASAWIPIATLDSLEARGYEAMAFDEARMRLVAYGGADAAGAWDQSASLPLAGPLHWTRFLPPSPPLVPGPRTGHVAVYDSRRARVLAYGGAIRRTDVPLWAFTPEDPGAWSPLFAAGAAPLGPALYDSLADRVLLFSGADTWALTFDPAPAWSVIDSSAPPNLDGASFTLDPVRHRVIVYGGAVDGPQLNFYTLADVWALALDSPPVWTHLGVGPTTYGSAGHEAFYDPVRDRLVILGGWWRNGSTIQHSYGNRMWATPLSGPLAWTEIASTGDDPLAGQTLYDPVRDRYLRFGLSPTLGIWKMWQRPAADSAAWSLLAWLGTGPLAPSPIVFDTRRDQAVMLFTAPNEAAPDQAWALIYANPAPRPAPSALALGAARPNPARGAFSVTVSLPVVAPARLELFDVAGRRCLSRDLGALGAGEHALLLGVDGTLRSGVYVMRLTQAGRVATSRVALLR